MSEEAKAVQEIAKTTGKAIDAAREFGGFIAKFMSGPLEQAVGMVEDKLKYHRWERQLRLMQRSEEFLQASGRSCPTRTVPLSFLVPLVQAASLEEDDQLQDRWAALLVNAANASHPVEVRRSYVALLEQLTSLDVQILEAIYSIPIDNIDEAQLGTSELPHRAIVLRNLFYLELYSLPAPPEDIVLSLSNLERLRLIRLGKKSDSLDSYGYVHPTVLGKALMHACRLPTASKFPEPNRPDAGLLVN